ncbi:hypothetical protein EJ08DRAFT_586307 [Tothia fuscella]|uniref:Integral membrane protein n=1 Tax=Tothia fuscella TaxID=1048955 RepID=A0A9P4TZU9_9PEZI|nr:hypothetical protein EJ08DRAFT_586307 [Tothia fuscella]
MGIPLAGKSLDITLFAFTRAMDIVLQSSSTLQSPKSQCTRLISNYATPVLFAASSATLMHAYFYSPNRLPYTYVKWIDRLSELDERLLHALREVRYGNFVYGKDTGMAPLLGSMCKELGLPEVWGDPEQTIPIPCEVVHHGSGPSCEWHAIMRFWRAWKKALGVYAPIQAVILVRALYKQPKNFFPALAQAIYNASRNSAFLGAFVSLFYYGVCLGRTRLGPKIISSKTISPQMWDGGLCITSGCLLCGWSVLLEIPRRRVELMLFVVPRALGVWFPRWYDRVHRWREQLAFAVSAAVILTAAQERPDRVRGVFGRVLRSVVAP